MSGETYLGRPCPRGHSGERYVSNWRCVLCSAKRNRRRRRAVIGTMAPVEPLDTIASDSNAEARLYRIMKASAAEYRRRTRHIGEEAA